jgi:hypothetical protein
LCLLTAGGSHRYCDGLVWSLNVGGVYVDFLHRFALLVPSILTEYIQDCPTWSLCLADFISVQVFESQL